MPTPVRSPGKAQSKLPCSVSPMLVPQAVFSDCGLASQQAQDDVAAILALRPSPAPPAALAPGSLAAKNADWLMPLATPRGQEEADSLPHFVSPDPALSSSVERKSLPSLPEAKKLLAENPGARAATVEKANVPPPRHSRLSPVRAFGKNPKTAVLCHTGRLGDDCVEADRVPLSVSRHTGERGCFRLRHVQVGELQRDGTLGLLLHGTSIVGFRSLQAEGAGWKIGDQIVEINARRAGNFDEFQECLTEAQRADGFPIDFSVLRREETNDTDDNGEAALEDFFNSTDFTKLADELQKRWHEEVPKPEACSVIAGDVDKIVVTKLASAHRYPKGHNGTDFTMDNPYVQALNRRRDALVRSSKGWAKWADDGYVESNDSIASRLAQRRDGMSTLHYDRDDPNLQGRESCGAWPFCGPAGGGSGAFCGPAGGGNVRCFEMVEHELAPTPRVHRYCMMDSRCEPDDSEDFSRDSRAGKNSWLPFAAAVASQMADNAASRPDLAPVFAASATAMTSEADPAASGTLAQASRGISDSDKLVQLLLASPEFSISSNEDEDGQESEMRTTPGQDSGTFAA